MVVLGGYVNSGCVYLFFFAGGEVNSFFSFEVLFLFIERVCCFFLKSFCFFFGGGVVKSCFLLKFLFLLIKRVCCFFLEEFLVFFWGEVKSFFLLS